MLIPDPSSAICVTAGPQGNLICTMSEKIQVTFQVHLAIHTVRQGGIHRNKFLHAMTILKYDLNVSRRVNELH